MTQEVPTTNNRRRKTAVLIAIAAVAIICIYFLSRSSNQDQLDRSLVNALKDRDVPNELRWLKEGANANTLVPLYMGGEVRAKLPAIVNCYAEGDETAWISLITPLLDHGANINGLDENGRPVLWWAARMKNNRLVRLLIDRGANVNIIDNEGQTPLLQAVSSGNLDGASMLLKAHADIGVKDILGKSALAIASSARNRSMVALLQKAGARE